MSFVRTLRQATAADHEMVDAHYGGFALDRPAGYRSFLTAHARALPAVERALVEASDLPPWRSRTALLAADLHALDAPMPAPLPFQPGAAAERWGALYVIEGSRLGGQLLARSVPAGLPSAYLAAHHLPGEWRRLLTTLDTHAAGQGQAWQDAALAGARACFALYARAAAIA